jgi:hypothetical protein
LSSAKVAFDFGADTIPVNIDNVKLKRVIPDMDKDGVEDQQDNCPQYFNPDQTDSNDNGIGDVCEGSQTGKNDNLTGNSYLVYPNPTSRYLNIRGKTGSVIRLYDMLGILIETKTITDDQVIYNLEDLPKGLYLIKANYENTIIMQKVVLQ